MSEEAQVIVCSPVNWDEFHTDAPMTGSTIAKAECGHWVRISMAGRKYLLWHYKTTMKCVPCITKDAVEGDEDLQMPTMAPGVREELVA